MGAWREVIERQISCTFFFFSLQCLNVCFSSSERPKSFSSFLKNERRGTEIVVIKCAFCDSLVGFLWFTIKSINMDHKVNMKKKVGGGCTHNR